MQVFTVQARGVEGGFIVTCPDFPEFSYTAPSLDHIYDMRELIAKLSGVAADRDWLQIEVHTGRIDLVSSIHPLHQLSLHTFAFSRTSGGPMGSTLDELVSIVLHHENQYVKDLGRDTPGVRFTASYQDGRKIQLPCTGTYPLADILAGDQTRAGEGEEERSGVLAWLQQRMPLSPEVNPLQASTLRSLQCLIVALDLVPSTRYR